jgi:hypothetical protein
MTHRGMVPLIAAMMLASAPAAAQISNGGFENPSDDPPVLGQWQYVAGAIRDTSMPHSGSFAANLENFSEATNVNVQQQTAVGSIVPGTEYELSFWAQAEYGVSGVGQVQLAFLNANGNILPGSPQFFSIPASASYVEYEQNFMAPANSAALFLGVNSVTGAVMGASAHVYVDDVSFTAASSFAPAYFNQDTFVDEVDFSIWTGAFGVTNEADADGDNDSDGVDFLAWQLQFGSSTAAAVASVAVPEPASLVVFFTGLVAIFRRSRMTGAISSHVSAVRTFDRLLARKFTQAGGLR